MKKIIFEKLTVKEEKKILGGLASGEGCDLLYDIGECVIWVDPLNPDIPCATIPKDPFDPN